MTLAGLQSISKAKVLPFPNNQYARWRLESSAAPLLREQGEAPPERLLQVIWQHQRLRRDELVSLDGETVRVLHPGFINREGGPDFREALVQFGSAPPRAGDVEVDLHANGWHAHGHDRNPAFENVILHVIWEAEGTGSGVPASGGPAQALKPQAGLRLAPTTVALRGLLDAPIGELSVWLESESAQGFPVELRGRCSPALHALPAGRLTALLREAARIRFQSKASQLQARARQAGWEQALWEGLFRALGYKHNAWPMQCLAEQRRRWLTPRVSALGLQARLFGISGLLPSELTRAQDGADSHLRSCWDRWWRERDEFAECTLPRSLWRFHGQRPANHPQRRLALAAHWLATGGLVRRIERWCAAGLPDARLAGSLLETLRPGPDEFWPWHWTIRSARLRRPQPLLGPARVTDLAVNVILPWLWVRAAEGRNEGVQHTVEHRFHVWPRAQDNAVLRLARQRLLNGAPRRALRSAAEQQGLIQITRDFCEHADALCGDCRLPELLRNLISGNPSCGPEQTEKSPEEFAP